jgi:hypothetical protein
VRVTDHRASTIHWFERRSFALAIGRAERARLGIDRIVIIEEIDNS